MENELNVLAAWADFYVIVGSSAGALVGLQFVVVTLIADKPIPDMERAGNAFATPTIVHFGAVLLLSGILSAPWQGGGAARAAWGLLGLFGIVYSGVVARRMGVQKGYRPELSDWLFNIVLPVAAYATLAASAFAAGSDAAGALFAVGGAALGLLFIGIHNAWDAITYHVFVVRAKDRKSR